MKQVRGLNQGPLTPSFPLASLEAKAFYYLSFPLASTEAKALDYLSFPSASVEATAIYGRCFVFEALLFQGNLLDCQLAS